MKMIASLSFALPVLKRASRWGGALLLAAACLAAPLRAQEVAEDPPAEVETALPVITIPAEAAEDSVVEIANGTYAPLNLLTETRTLTLRAANPGQVIIEGGNTERCATLPDNITLEGFVLQNGKARQGGGLRGGVFLNGTISNCSAVFGGGAYEAKVVNSEVIGCSAEFFGNALYGGSAFSCRIIGNHAADYGAGMAALFGTKAANCLLAENTTPCDTAGALASPVQNMLLYKNTATKGTAMTAEAMAQDVCVNGVEEAKVVTAEAGLFKDAAAGDYTLNLDHGTVNTALKDKGDSALGGFYDLLWHATDFAGRPRILGTDIDIGPYEIADTVTVTCTVIGAGEVTASAKTVQEGDTVTFTASKISGYERDFLGFYVNGELRTTKMTFSLAITNSDVIEARFQGLSATTENFATQIGALHPTLREELLLADGAYTLDANTVPDSKQITFKGTTLGGTTLSVSGDLKGAILVNATVNCTAALSNVTLHRCLVSGLTGIEHITVTSSILKTMPTSLTATLANVTVYGSGDLPGTVAAINCLVLNTDISAENFDWVGQAILPKGSDSIDAGTSLSLTPYDNLDIAGRPRSMGHAIDLGAHECFYVAMTVAAEGEYTTLTPEPGVHDYLAGDTLALAYTSSRAFLGWTLNGEALGTEVNSLVIPEESIQVLTATFQGFTLSSGAAFPEGATSKDTITLGEGSYNWEGVSTEAKIVGTGTQSEVTITGSITGGRFEAITLNATLTNATLNRCLVKGGMLTNCTVANSVIEAATLTGGTYVNNTVLSGITLPSGAVNTRTVSAVQADYTPAVTDTTVVDSGSELNDYQKTLVGDLDYYGNPRVNNVRIDLGAAEYVWSPYTVTIAVVGHGLVEPRGAVEVVRGQSLTFTAKEDPKHTRGTPVVTVGSEELSGTDSHYTYTPTADNTVITVTFTGLAVGERERYKTISAAIAEAQDGETITVQAGTYLERVDVKTKKLRIVAAEADATKTIIDANHEGRAVTLNENSEIIGFTIINGAASEGAGVRGGTVRRCIIHDNTLTYNGFGGGVYGAFAESCLIYNNGSATQRSSGGGASNSELLNCTVAANAAEKGGGLYDCTAKNCVIALNTDLTGTASDWAGDSIEPAPDDCCTPTTGGITVEANKIFVRPESADFRLREGIACLNAAAADERLSALDVFGTQRPYGTGTDMGAIEWNAPDYVVTLSFNSRSQATMVVNEGDSTAQTYTCAWNGSLAARTFTVPRFKADGTTRTEIKLTWTKATGSATVRDLSGILLDGGTLSGSSAAADAAGFTWQVTSENTVNVDLSFQAESLTVAPGGKLSQALDDATPGETIKLQDGDYNLAVSVGEGVTLEGTGSSSLLQGATLADGAILKGVTVTGAPVVGPETGSATLLHSIVTGVTDGAGAVKQNVVVKSSLIHNNAAGLGANVTAYLSTVADTDGTALAATAKAYGCAIWRYSRLAETGAEIVDCWAGIEPGFLAPAPEGEDYHLSAHSELIDAAGTAQWPGFTEADRALTDLAGQPRNLLQGYDCGAYEYQGTATVTDWTWFGSAASMDGDLAGAGWRQMTLGSAHALPANVAAVWADRNGYPEANVRADAPLTLSALTIKTVNTCFALLQGSEAGRVTVTGTLMKSAASSLVLAGPLTVQGGTTLSAGTVTVAEGADIKAANVTLNGSTTFRQTGGNFTFGNFFYVRDTGTFSLEGGTFKGGELSLAKGSNQTALVFAGADVTLTRIETGDESGARYGDIIQTGGTVTLTGSGSGKSAPLHISHWPGSSTYSLRGGTLYVPNGEVRLGQDGTGTLSLEGGVAKIRSIGRSNGSVVLAGGTFHALESQALNYVSYKSGTESRLEVADGKKTLTFYGTTDSSNTGGLTLGPGNFVAYNTIAKRNLTLSAGTCLTLSTADGEALTDRGALNLASPYTLTVPGEGEVPVLTGTLQAAPLAVAKDLPLNTSTLVLQVKGSVSGLTSAYENCYEITTQPAEDNTEITNVYVKQILNRPASSTIPVLTVSGQTDWDTAAKWSTGSVPAATTPVIVRATETATLKMPIGGTLAQVTFDVAEGKTLTLDNYNATIAELRLIGAGTLDLGTVARLSYTNQTAFSGTMVVSHASQELKEATIKNQHLRFAVNYALGSCAGFTLAGGIEVAAEKTLTCDSSLAGGEARVEAGATVVIGQGCTNRLNFTAADGQVITLAAGTTGTNPAYLGGNVNAQNWKITDDNGTSTKGLTLTGSVTLATPPTSGKLAASALSSLTLKSGKLTLASAWAMPAGAVKAGAGRVTLPSGSSMAGSATFRGPIAFAEAKTFSVSGDLVFRDGSVIYLPIGATFSATGSLVVEPGTRVVLTGTPEATQEVDLFKSTQAGGLSISTLTEVALALENPPADKVVTLTPYLTAAGVYGYTLTLTEPNIWTGATDSNWSNAANWSNDTVPADGAAVSFPDSVDNKAVTIDTAIAPSAIRVVGNYTFSGNGPITSKPAIAQSAGEVTWNLFPKAGSYDVASGATAVISSADGYYEGRFTGDGTVRVTGTLELGASSIAFQGRFEVNQGQLALRLGAATASAGVNLVGGTLKTKVPATVSKLDLSGTSSLVLPLSAPLTVTDAFTASGTVFIAVDAIPEEAGFWLLMTLPEEAAETTFGLTTNSASDTYRAGVVQRGREVFLAVYDSTQIAWAGTGTGADKWVINTSAIEATETANKVVWFHDVDGVGEPTVSLPETPTSVMVTAQTTHFTLEGTFGAVPVTVQSGASVTLAATDMTLSTFVNDGTVTVTGTLDLTNTTFSGTGTFIAGTGGTIKVTAQQLAATTNLFKRGGGRLEVSGGNSNYTYPSGALSGGTAEGAESGELVKTGTGTLYLQPTAFNESLTIQEGSVALSGTIALKARYFKFEIYERFNDTANTQNAWNWVSWNWAPSTWLGLSEVALTLSGERLAWPEGSSIIYFDGGVLDSVVLGMGNRTSFCDGQITNLLDGNTATQFRWLDNYQYASYGQGANPRTYFVVDAGREVVFSGYDFATPTIPNQFFYKWNVSAANDLQAWHPSASDTGPTENESEIWQTIDERTLAASSSLLKANSWMTTRGYAFTNKGSGFWSSLSGPVKVSSGATFDLTSAVGNTHILEDSLTLASVTGEGTLRVPTSLNLTLDTLNIGKLQLTGSTILTQPITATSATVTTLALDSEVAQAYTDNGGVDFVLLTNCTAKPALSWPDGVPQTTTDGGTWGLVLLEEDKTLHLRLSGSKREIKATISGTKTWSDLQWTDPLGVNVSLTSPTDAIVERVVLVPEGEGATLSSMDFTQFPNLKNVLLAEAGGTLTLSDTSALTSNANVLLTVPQAATLRVTSPDALAFAKNSASNLQLNNANIRLRGAGTLLLDFADAANVLLMVGNQGLFTGNITVASGTLKFPNNSSGTGPVYNRTITVKGEKAKLATGTNTDATGWSYGSGKFIFREGATFEVYKRDTYKAPIELCGATIRLMAGATESNRGIDLYESPSTTVLAADGATAENPTVSKLTFAENASASDRIAYVRGGNWTVNVAEHARFDIEATLGADNSDRTLIKAGAGEMVLATTVNNCLNTLINAGTLRVTGTTGTGSTIVKGGATICGTGTVRGTISFASGGLLAVDPAVVEPLTISRFAQTTSWANITLTGTPTQTFPILRATAENFKLLTDYFKTDEAFPTNDYSLVVVDNVLYAKKILKQGDQVVEAPTSLQATVPSGTTNWSELTWTTDSSTEVDAEAIDWWQVKSVSLTAAEGAVDATVDLDLPLYNVQTLTLAGALTLTGNEGNRLNGCTLALTNGATATINGLFDGATAVSLSGNGTVTWAADHTGTLSLAAGTTLTAPAGITLSALDCTAGGTLAVDPANPYTVTAITGQATVKATGSISDGVSLLKVGSTVAVVNFALDTNFPAGYGLAVDNGTLKAVVGSEVMAVVSGAAVWESLTWTDTRGNAFTPTWSNIRAVTLKVTDSATLALPTLSLASLAIDFGETEEKSLTLNSSTSQTLPALYVLGTNGGDVLCNDGTLTLSALSASAPYVGVTAEMLSGLTSGTNTYTFASDAVLGLYCTASGSSIAGYLKAPQRGIAIRSGTLKASREDNFGGSSDNTKIRIDADATFDVDGWAITCEPTLNGGTLRNNTRRTKGNGLNTDETQRQLFNITLTADSIIDNAEMLNSVASNWNAQTLTLNSHTLTKRGNGFFGFRTASVAGDGVLNIEAGTLKLADDCTLSGNVSVQVAKGATFTLTGTRTLSAGATLTLEGTMDLAATLTGEGAVTVASGSVSLSGLTTYTGLTTVQGGATLSAASLAGSLTCETGATLKPRAIDTPLSLGGTLTATNLVIDLSAFAEQPETIPLFTSPNELTTTMVATAGRYKPAVVQMEDGTWKLSYVYRFDGDTALTWEGGATGDLADATWRADGVSGLSLLASNGMIFPADGTYTLTNNNNLLLAFPTGAVTIGANATVTLSSTREQSGLCGDVTLENGATLKLVDSFAAYAGITGSGATLEMDVSMLAVPRGDLSVGTLKLTGSTLPTGTPRETFTCTTLVFSEELVAAIEAATTQQGTILTLASAYTGNVPPACTTLPAGYALKKTEAGALVVAFTAQVVTKLYAQVSGSGAWTGLTWYTDEAYTTKPTAIAWGAVTAVTLTNTANAPVALTLPGNLTALTTMTIGSASKAITLSGATLPTLNSLTLNGPLTLDGAVISTIPASLSGTGTLTFKNAAVSSTRGDNDGSNFAYNDFTGRWVVERGATLTLAETATENQLGLLNWDSNVADSGQIEVRAGGTLAVNQKNAFGWNNVSAQKDHTVLVVDGGTVTIGTNEQHFRRKMEWHPGAVLDNQGTTFYLTRGVTMNVVAGESTAPVIFRGNAIKLKGDNACDGNANTAFVVAAGAVLQVDATIVQSNADDALTLSGAGTVLLNGANTHTQATTVAAGTTIGGTGLVTNSAVTFEEGSKLLAEGGSSVLTLNDATGRAQVVLDESVAESALPMAVLKTAETATVTLVPPADYQISSATADGVTTHTLDLIRYTALTATVDGTKGWNELSWQTPDGTPIASPRWAWVTALTLNVTADASLTLPGNFSSITSLTLPGTGTLTLSGGSLPALTSLSLSGNLTLDGAVITTIPAALSGTGTLTLKNAGEVTSSAAGGASTFAYNSFTGRWIIETGTTLNLAGGGGQYGQLAKSDVEGSGQIVVKAGATVKLSEDHVFGWKDIDAQCNRTVLVLDGGALVNNAEQYLRRTFELKNGATLSDPNGNFWLARAGRLLVSEGLATILDSGSGPKLGCDGATNGSNSTSAPSRIEVGVGATLTVEASLTDKETDHAYALALSGAGTVLFNGANTHTKATTVAAGTTIGGTGSITASSVTLHGSKILTNASGEALTLSTVTGSATIVVPEGFPTTGTTAVLKTNSTSAPTLTPPTGYVMSEATADGIKKTVYLEWMPYDSLTAEVSGTVALSALNWKTPEGTAVASPEWRFVNTVTFKGLTADATVTMDGELAETVTTLTGTGETVTLAGEMAWTVGTRTFAGNLALSRALASGTLSVATGATLTLSADNSAFTGTLNLAAGSTLRATQVSALAFAQTDGVVDFGVTTLPIMGNGVLELALPKAETLQVKSSTATPTVRFAGDILVSSGTMKFPNSAVAGNNWADAWGPVYARTITVRGERAKLATGSNTDATGWSVGTNQKLILEEGGSYELSKRDTFKTPLEMTGGIIRLMPHTEVNLNCALQIFNGQQTTVKAVNGATSASPTISKLTLEASDETGDWRKAMITNANWQVTVEENAQFYIDAVLSGDWGFVKSDKGEMVLAAENVYTGVTTINAGTLRVTGTTGAGTTTVENGAIICGSGTVKGALTFEDGAIFAADPADSLTVNGAVTAGGTVIVRLASVPTETVALLTAASLPAVSAFSAENLPEGFALVVVGNTLYAEKQTAPTLVQATVNGDAAWESLSWQTMAGTALSGTIDWATLEAVTLHISEDATLSGVPALKTDGQLVLDFTAATEKTLTLEATESRTLPAVTIAGTAGGNLLADSATFTLTSLAAASGCPYLGTSPELLGTLTASTITFSENALIGLLCSADGSSLPLGKTLKAPQQGFAIRTGTFQPVQADTFGNNTVNTKIRVDTGAALDVNGYATTCVLTLNGGTLTNTGNGVGSNSRQLANITLTADSVIETSKEINSIDHYYAVQTLTLNGHTLTKRGSATFGFYNASIVGGGGRIVVEEGTLQFIDNGSKANTISGAVTFENKGGTLTLSDAYTVAADSTLTFKGNVTVTRALTVGENAGVKIAYDGDVVPTSGLASLDTCAQVTFSETFWKAIEMKTAAMGTVFTLATSYGLSTAPYFESKTGYALEAQVTSAEGAETTTYALVLTYAGAISDVTAVQATVSRNANWSALAWKDMDGNAVTPTWGKVTSVTLTAEAAATITVDLPIATVTSLTATGSGALTLAAGTSAGFPTGTLTLTNANLTVRDLYAPAAAVTVSGTGTGSLTWELTRGVAHTGAIKTPSTVAFKTQGDMTLSSTSNYFRGSFSVLSGETVLSCGSQGGGEGATRGLEGDVTIAQGATLRLKSGDAFDYSLSTSSPQQINVLGTLAIDAKATLLPVNTLLLGEGAQVTSSLDTLALDFYGANVPIKVTGPGAVIDAKIGAHDANKSATATFSQGASLELRSALNSTSFSLTTALANAASEGTLILTGAQSGTGTLRVGDGVILAGSGSWGDAVIFEAGAKLLVDPAAEAPLTLNGAISDKAQVVLASTPTTPSTAAVKTTAENVTLSTGNFTAPEGYELTLSADSKTLYVTKTKKVYTSLTATVDGTVTTWSQLPWTTDGSTEATDINWAFVEEVYLTVEADVALRVDVALPKVAALYALTYSQANVTLTSTLSEAPFTALATLSTMANIDFAVGTVAKVPANIQPSLYITVRFADNLIAAVQEAVIIGTGSASCTVVFDGTNTFTAPVTVKKGATLAGSGRLAADVTFENGSAVLADGAALTVGTVTVADGATVTVTPAAGLADATVLVAANALTESNFTEPTGYSRTVVEGTTLKLSRNLTLEVKYQDEALETVLSDAAKQRIREQVCKVADTAVTGTIATKIEVLHADGATVKAVDTSALEGLLTCFKNHTAATVDGTTAKVKVCYDFGVSHITVDADRAVIVTAKVEGQSAEVDFAEGVSFSVVDMNTGMVWSMAPGDLLEQTTGEVRFKIPADRLDDANDTNSQKLLEDFIGTRALRVKVTREESR